MAEEPMSLEEELEQARQEYMNELQAQTEPKTEAPSAEPSVTTAEPTAEPTAPMFNDMDLVDPAIGVLGRLPDADRRRILEEKYGYDLTPKKELEQQKTDIAQGAQQKTFEDILNGMYQNADKSMLPTDFAELDAGTQYSILKAAEVETLASKKAQEAVSPILAEQQEREYQGFLDNVAAESAKGMGAPDAAPLIRQFAGSLSKEEVAWYFQQKEKGGGAFTYMVDNYIQSIVDNHVKEQQTAKEIPLPKSEETGGGEDDDTPTLKGDAKKMYDQAKKMGMSPQELKEFAKELASV